MSAVSFHHCFAVHMLSLILKCFSETGHFQFFKLKVVKIKIINYFSACRIVDFFFYQSLLSLITPVIFFPETTTQIICIITNFFL